MQLNLSGLGLWTDTVIIGRNKEYPEINFNIDENLIHVKMMAQFINDRMLYQLNDTDTAG